MKTTIRAMIHKTNYVDANGTPRYIASLAEAGGTISTRTMYRDEAVEWVETRFAERMASLPEAIIIGSAGYRFAEYEVL